MTLIVCFFASVIVSVLLSAVLIKICHIVTQNHLLTLYQMIERVVGKSTDTDLREGFSERGDTDRISD